MKLYFRTLGAGDPLIIMHGVFGSSDNWQTLGKVFSERFKVYLVDLRNHGNSPHSDEFDYHLMVDDVVELMENQGLSKSHVLGHSMGGKVAMYLSTKHPEVIDKLIVVDIAPKYYAPRHQQIFEGFRAVNLKTLQNRKEADEQMLKVISHIDVRQFILKNLDRKKDGTFRWRVNVDAIETATKKIEEEIECEGIFDGVSLFIVGSKSDYITDEDHKLIRLHFPKATIVSIEGAGHWVHTEKPEELGRLVIKFLSA